MHRQNILKVKAKYKKKYSSRNRKKSSCKNKNKLFIKRINNKLRWKLRMK